MKSTKFGWLPFNFLYSCSFTIQQKSSDQYNHCDNIRSGNAYLWSINQIDIIVWTLLFAMPVAKNETCKCHIINFYSQKLKSWINEETFIWSCSCSNVHTRRNSLVNNVELVLTRTAKCNGKQKMYRGHAPFMNAPSMQLIDNASTYFDWGIIYHKLHQIKLLVEWKS